MIPAQYPGPQLPKRASSRRCETCLSSSLPLTRLGLSCRTLVFPTTAPHSSPLTTPPQTILFSFQKASSRRFWSSETSVYGAGVGIFSDGSGEGYGRGIDCVEFGF